MPFTAKPVARWKADAGLASVALVWGVTFVAVKQAITQMSAMYFLALRFSLATLCQLLLFMPVFLRMPRRELLHGLKAGFLAGVFLWAGYVLQTFGLHYTSAANSGFLTGLYIVLVPLIGAAIYRQMPALREWAALGVATVGMAVMAWPSSQGFALNRGDLLTVACAVAFAFHLLLLGYFSKRENIQALTLGQIACTALLSFCALAVEHPMAIWSPSVASAIVLTAVFATAVAFAVQTWAQKHTTATRTALIFALEPVFALATAIASGEPARLTAIVGGVLILAGIVGVEIKLTKPAVTSILNK